MISAQLLEQVFAHAEQTGATECCGLIIALQRKHIYYPCINIATSHEHFIIDAADYAAAEDMGEIIAIVHSHPSTNPTPSQADMVGIERSQLPWLIVNANTKQHTWTEPTGYITPLLGREFHHGVLDCYTIIRDYYQQQLNITLPDFERPDQWWLKGHNLYREYLDIAGFYEVPLESLQAHDMVIMRMASPVENHGAVYIGDTKIMQHVAGRLSSIDVYGGYWRKATTCIARHRSIS